MVDKPDENKQAHRKSTVIQPRMLAMKKKNLVVTSPIGLYEDYKTSCTKVGKTLSQMTRELMEAFVDGRLRIKPDPKLYVE